MSRKNRKQQPAIVAKAAAEKAVIDAIASSGLLAEQPAPAEAAAPEATTSGRWDHKVRSVVPLRYKQKYRPFGDTCGDTLATELALVLQPDGKNKPMSLDAYRGVCEENGIDPTRWAARNSGMQRMNLANVLRGRQKRGETVTINGKTL